MCRRAMAIGGVLMAAGAALLLSMLVPRCFFTAVLGAGLLALGWVIRR